MSTEKNAIAYLTAVLDTNAHHSYTEPITLFRRSALDDFGNCVRVKAWAANPQAVVYGISVDDKGQASCVCKAEHPTGFSEPVASLTWYSAKHAIVSIPGHILRQIAILLGHKFEGMS